jgi:hypothetical protein
MEWTKVIESPEFSDLSTSEQNEIRQHWVDNVYVPQLLKEGIPEEDIPGARYEALDRYDNGQGYVSSFASSAAQGLLGLGTSAIQGVGVLSGLDSLEEVGTDLQESVQETFTTNPVMGNTNFTGQVLGNVAGFIGTAGAGGLVGKGLGAAARGAEIGGLGAGFLAGAGGGAQEADEYGITGGDRYLRALGGGLTEVLTEKIPGLGMASELKALSRIPGLGGLASPAAGGVARAVGSEIVEENLANIGGNVLTGVLAPDEVATPGIFDGTLEATAAGAIGGAAFGGLGLLAPSTKVNTAAVNEAEKAGDDAAAAILRQVGADAKMMPVPPPSVPDLKPGETGLEDLLPEPAPADFTPLTAEELPPEIEGLNPEPALPPSVAPVVDEEQIAAPVVDIEPDPVLPDEQELEQRAFEASLIDTQGRISEPAAVQVFDAINALTGGNVKLVVNDSGTADPNDTGVRGSLDNGTVYLNRNLVRADTPVHEMGHVFIPTLRTANPDLFAQGEALIAGAAKPLADAIRSRYERRGKTLDPEAFTHEVLTTLYGNETAQDWQQYVRDPGMIQQIKQWIARIREWADGLFRSKGIDPNMSMADYAKRLNRQVLAGKVRAPAVPAAGQQESFAGENAQMGDLRENSLITAKLMQQRGRAPEEIRQVTGWFPGKADGKMRYEIADRGARLAVKTEDPKEVLIDKASDGGFTVDFGPNKSVTVRRAGTPWAVDPASVEGLPPLITRYQYPAPPFVSMMDEVVDRSTTTNPMLLPEVLDHPDLFKAYPDLQNVAVLPITPDMGQGVWSKSANAIGLTTNYPWNEDTLLRTVMHEVQHAIQDIEGFSRGASPAQFTGPDAVEQYRAVPGEVESRDVERRIAMSDEELAAVPPRAMDATGQAPAAEGIAASTAAPSRFDEMLAREDARRAAASNGKTFRVDGVQSGYASEADDAPIIPLYQKVTIVDPTHPANGSSIVVPLNGRPAPLPDDVIQAAVDAKRNQQFSLDEGTRQSGVAANQPGTPMREIAKHHIYNSETGEQAFDEALGFFMEEPNATFDQRLATLNALINDRGRDNFNMTPGAYFGLVAEEQTAIETSPTSSPSEREQAVKNLHTLMDLVAAKAAAGGQFIKGFDLGLKLANNPRMQVDKAEELAPFDGEQGRRDEFDKEVNAVTKVIDDVALDTLSEMEESEVESIINQGAADVIRGDDASDAGAAEMDAIVSKDADAAEAEDTPARKSWAGRLMDKVRSGAAKLAARWMVVMRAINVLNRKGDSSLSEDEIDADVKKLLKSMEEAGLTKAQQLAKLRGEATALQKQITDDKDLKTLTSERLSKNLNRLLNGKGKKTPQTSEKAIASAIVGAVMAKAGYQKPPQNTDMALAIGLLIANQGIAAESIQNAHTLLESDETSEGIISREKLKAFMELAVAKVFDKQSGADTTSAPFGEAQVASVLRAEMKKLEVTMTEAVKDAAMERQTAAQIEAQLRDPKRNLEKILGKENLDSVVNVVLGEYNKSSSQRAAELRARGEQLESDRAVREAAADSRRKRAENYKRQVERVRAELAKATEFARQGATPEAKQSRRVRVDELRAQLAAMNATEAERVAQMERADALAEADATAREAARDAKDKKRAFIRARKRERLAKRKAAKKDGTAQPPLEADELKDLMAQKGDTIIKYLTRNFGFNIKDLAKMVREADRRKGLEDLTLKLADELGLTKTQAEKLLQPVIAAGMKKLDASRAKQVQNRINRAIQTATNRDAGIKKGGQKTEAERLLDLAKMGGLTAENIEKVMLNNLGAKQFTPELRKSLEDLLTKANDPNISQESRDVYTAMFLNAVRSAQGITAVGLLGEWTMSNIFMAVLSTLKVNAFWGFAKSTVDNAVYGFYSGPKEIMDAAKEAGVNPPKGIRKAYLKQWLRGYSTQMQWNAKYMMAEGRAKDESDYTVQFANSFFELLAHNPDTQISWTKNGAPLPKSAENVAKAMARFGKWTRRSMVGTDLVNRVSAYEMLKMTAVTKAMIEGGKDLSGQQLTDHVDTALYGMPLKDALAKANKEVDAEIATGRTRPEERSIRIGGLLDEQMGKNLGMTEDIRMSEEDRMLALDRARRGAGRRTIANQTEGAYGLLSGLMLEGTRRIPGLRFLMPAVRMPIGAFSQGLDWSPWGFARYRAIKKNKGKSTSVTNAIFNPDNNSPWWNLPEGGVTPDMANDLWAKAFVGTTLMVGLFIKAGMDLDEDEDKADLYVTGMGPTDPVQKKLWKEKGYRPFMVRFGPISLNYQESPMYPIFATVGAWSDSHRYGKKGDTESAKIVYAIHKTMTGFKDAVVLRNLADIIGTGQSYSDESKAKQSANALARAASTVIAPRIGAEINNILFGPLDNQHWEAKIFANIPFVPRMFDQPALDWFGHEIHTRRGDAMGEVLPAVAHRISPIMTSDEKLSFIYRMKPNALTTSRKKTDGSDVMDDYDLVRKWHINSGKAAEKWLTPAKMKYYDNLMKKDEDAAYEEFDKELRELRQRELEKFKEVQF